MKVSLVDRPYDPEEEDPCFDVTIDGKPLNLVVQYAAYAPEYRWVAMAIIDEGKGPVWLPYCQAQTKSLMIKILEKNAKKAIAGFKRVGDNSSINNAVTHTENNEDTEMKEVNLKDLTAAGKVWVKEEAKTYKINPVGKSTEALFLLVSAKRNEVPSVTMYIANGGKVQELPGFTGIKPKPAAKQTSAGGKVAPSEEKTKRTPRKISKTEESKAEPKGDTVTLASILEELGVEGRIARRKLRNSDIPKPAGSWEWAKGHADIAKVRALLKK